MKRNINFKNVLCMAAITLVTGMLGGCEDNSIATPVGKLPNETALDNNFGMLKCDMTKQRVVAQMIFLSKNRKVR